MKSEAILKVPLWRHSLQCFAFVALALWGSAFVSHLLHKAADKIEAGEVSSLHANTSKSPSSCMIE